MRRLIRFVQNECGAVVLEFGLIVPILFFIVFGIVDFGRAYETLNNLASSVREAGRYGATLETPIAWSDSIKQRAVNFSYTFGGARLTTSQVTVVADTAAGTIGVTARYTFRPITPLMRLINLDSIPFQQAAVFRWERTSK